MSIADLRKDIYKPGLTLPEVTDQALLAIVNRIQKKEKAIIKLYYGLEGPNHTQQEIGDMTDLHNGVKISSTRIGQIRQRAIRNISGYLSQSQK